MFQSTYLYKVRPKRIIFLSLATSFNPRTYIRYDPKRSSVPVSINPFQSTYLYKVRQYLVDVDAAKCKFQSTYLYKVRLPLRAFSTSSCMFQSTYLYKVRPGVGILVDPLYQKFQSTYLYKVRLHYK